MSERKDSNQGIVPQNSCTPMQTGNGGCSGGTGGNGKSDDALPISGSGA